MTKNNRSKWPAIRISPELHIQLVKTSALESGKQKKPVKLVDWTNQVISAGLKRLGY